MAIHNDFGKWGEQYVAEQLARIAPVTAGEAADLRLGDVEIEVKTARPSLCDERGAVGFQFCLHRAGRKGVQGQVVVCLCVRPKALKVTAFVIPVTALGTRRKVRLPLDVEGYEGIWARYRDAWDVLALSN